MQKAKGQELHIGIDADTLQIRAICVTSNNVSDASVLPDLLEQLPPDETLQSLIGDGAYDTQPAYEAVIRHGAIPIIPPRKNARIGLTVCWWMSWACPLRTSSSTPTYWPWPLA